MAAKLKLDGLPGEIADRARAVFGGVVNDLDELLKKLGSKLSSGAGPTRQDLLRLIRALRKSLDGRLAALERAVGGPAKRPATKKSAGKTVRKAVKKSARPAARKPAKSAARRKR